MTDLSLEKVVRLALAEDIGSGDISSMVIDPRKKGLGYFLAKQDLVLCGEQAATLSFTTFDPKVVVRFTKHDGDRVKKGTRFGFVSGPLRSILTGERVALNFLQRLSGIATMTRQFTEAVKGSGVRILDTRKTTPLLRVLEKYAVRIGGGFNHRFNLSDGIIIKDNHIQAAGGIAKAVRKAKEIRTALVKIEVEVKDLKELAEALKSGAEHIMLDNMAPRDIKKAVALVKGAATLEVSGGVTLDNVKQFALRGIDYISTGYITHSAKAVDISLEVE